MRSLQGSSPTSCSAPPQSLAPPTRCSADPWSRQAGLVARPADTFRRHSSSTLRHEAAVEGLQQPGLIFERGAEGAWDEAAVGSPVVRCYVNGGQQRWFMWYSGRSHGDAAVDIVAPSSGSIGVATSSDGVRWMRGHGAVAGEHGEEKAGDVGCVLQPNPDWWWHDTCHLAVSDVQILSGNSVGKGVGVYWMFYAGGDYEALPLPPGLGPPDGGRALEGLGMRPGLAMSQDGRNWARIEAGHHTGALFDRGPPGAWDHAFVAAPQVVAAGPNDMRMYYHSFDGERGRWTVGLATSSDGFRWDKRGPVFAGGDNSDCFDGAGAAARHVVRDAATRQYVMFYEGVAASGARGVGVAVSADGLKGWRRLGRPLLEAAGDSTAWDAGAVGAPCAVPMAEGRWRLYYAGRAGAQGPWQGIGMALNDPEDSTTFEGIRLNFKRRSMQ